MGDAGDLARNLAIFAVWGLAIAFPAALLLRWLVRVIGGLRAGYVVCYLAFGAAALLALVPTFGAMFASPDRISFAVFFPIMVLTQMLLFPRLIHDDQGAVMGYGRAFLIGLLMVAAAPVALYVILAIAMNLN